MNVYQVTYRDEQAYVVQEKPNRGPTRIEVWYFKNPSKTFEVLLSDRKKINKLLKLK